MIDKILKMFFIKKQVKDKERDIIVLKRKTVVTTPNEKVEIKKPRKEVVTCLSEYFTEHRGLNLLERGHTYL